MLKNPQLKFIIALNFCNYACTFTIQGLWGGRSCARSTG